MLVQLPVLSRKSKDGEFFLHIKETQESRDSLRDNRRPRGSRYSHRADQRKI